MNLESTVQEQFGENAPGSAPGRRLLLQGATSSSELSLLIQDGTLASTNLCPKVGRRVGQGQKAGSPENRLFESNA